MSTPLQKQKRLQIILAIIIGVTIPCYSLGFIFLSVNRRSTSTITPGPENSPTVTWSPRRSATSVPVVPTRYPTFTPTLTGTATLTPTASLTPSSTPTATETDTPTASPTPTDLPSDTPSPSTDVPTDTPGSSE